MSLRLLLDEDTQAKRLVSLLREAGHDVQTVTEAGLTDQSDLAVLTYARRENRLVLTRNCEDFQVLHRTEPAHPGIIGVFQYNNPAKDLYYQDKSRMPLALAMWMNELPFQGQYRDCPLHAVSAAMLSQCCTHERMYNSNWNYRLDSNGE